MIHTRSTSLLTRVSLSQGFLWIIDLSLIDYSLIIHYLEMTTMKKLKKGFTLIEMVVVIIIISVVAAILVPAYGRFYIRQSFEAGVGDVQDAFAYAREQALAKDAPVTLVYDAQSDSFTINLTQLPPPADQPSSFPDTSVDNATLNQAHSVQLDRSVSISGFTSTDTSLDSVSGGTSPSTSNGRGATSVKFRSDGTSDGAELTVVDSANGYSAHMILQPGTGHLIRDDDSSNANDGRSISR